MRNREWGVIAIIKKVLAKYKVPIYNEFFNF